MLYSAYDQMQNYWQLWGEQAHSWSNFYREAGLDNPRHRRLWAFLEFFERLVKRYPRAPFDIHDVVVRGERVGVTESIVCEKPFAHLLHFKKNRFSDMPPILVFAPLSGHHSSLLRRTVRTLLQDYDVYITDWLDPRFVPTAEGSFDLSDFIQYSIDFMTFFEKRVHVLAICQPAPTCLAAAAWLAMDNHPLQPRSLTLMGGPIDVAHDPTAVDEIAASLPFSFFQRLIAIVPEGYPGQFRRVYPGYLQHLFFVSMHPDNHIREHLRYYESLRDGDDQAAARHRAFYDTYHATLDMTEEFYLQTIQVLFQENAWANNQLTLWGRPVSFEAIHDVPLMIVEAEFDDICSPGHTRKALDLCSSLPDDLKNYLLVPGAGHYGVFSSRTWEQKIYPQLCRFTQRFDAAA